MLIWLPLKISVVLLTKNGGALLAECLDAVASQRLGQPYEVIAIDSGSTDGSAELLAADPRVRLVRIAPAEFQHGHTRNLAMRTAAGELVVFLTQDAVPAGPDWLAAFERFMQGHPEVAGAFGRQVPRDDADALEAWEVSRHFETFRRGPVVFRRPAMEHVPSDGVARARLHFFSNVNSCIRREAWARVPFPEIEFGEDQLWAREVQRAGMATGYADEAVVRHSHDYGPLRLFARRYDEARFMHRHLGYALMPELSIAMRVARAHAHDYRGYLATLGERRLARTRAAWRAWASALGTWAGTLYAGRDGLVHRMFSLNERLRRA
jgi:rhamnosyltransferase